MDNLAVNATVHPLSHQPDPVDRTEAEFDVSSCFDCPTGVITVNRYSGECGCVCDARIRMDRRCVVYCDPDDPLDPNCPDPDDRFLFPINPQL